MLLRSPVGGQDFGTRGDEPSCHLANGDRFRRSLWSERGGQEEERVSGRCAGGVISGSARPVCAGPRAKPPGIPDVPRDVCGRVE